MDSKIDKEAASVLDLGAVLAASGRFEAEQGRRPRILVATTSGDGDAHGLAARFAGMGFDADVGPAASTMEDIAAQAVDADVHAICLGGNPGTTAIGKLRSTLATAGRPDIFLWASVAADLPNPHQALALLARLADGP